ncbi:hypothetical protein LSH36_128g02009 [Paralvinella palmiformis]|uniref:Uncharacterized protein n=1 Tax=Paralvinella palmiformis TaxID=53620 RepID=A0AAD9N845_9ANNE|nr:hypothetical protein LSH36_128g02009 [Paralvinella palmiformis]
MISGLLYVIWLTVRHLAYCTSSGLLYVIWLTVRHLAYCMSSGLLYVICLTVHHLAYCTSSGLLYVIWLTVHHLAYCTSSGLLYIIWLTVRHLAYCTSSGLLYAIWLTVRHLSYCTSSGLLGWDRFYSLSYLWYSMVAVLVVCGIGIPVSCLSAVIQEQLIANNHQQHCPDKAKKTLATEEDEDADPETICPIFDMICAWLPLRHRQKLCCLSTDNQVMPTQSQSATISDQNKRKTAEKYKNSESSTTV